MRIETHPILEVRRAEPFSFFISGKELLAYPGETIASALFANGIRIFGRHPKDGSPQGIFAPTASAPNVWSWPMAGR